MDVGDWLHQLDLERYFDAFTANGVDWAVLPTLTADDLREIGVAAVGDRRKLLNAIADLAASATVPSSIPVASERPAQSVGPERRQLTVMFCDLVGSTQLAVRFDPEDLREIVGAYHRIVADTTARFGGFVAKYMGDGVLVYFGYPEAHEEDAERAVRAGLALIDAVGDLNGPEPLQVRLGIASGLVVVGDLIGEGAAQERGVVGETPNLAARLQNLSGPNSIVIAEGTRRQLGTLFDVDDLGPQSLAGFTEPHRAWRVIGESSVVSRFEALRSGATPLVGRDEELELLRRRWQAAQDGEGRVVLISGEPGIGKSRLTESIADAIDGKPPLRLHWFCSPYHQDSPLHPFIVQLERAAGFARDDSTERRLAKLDMVLAAGEPAPDELALLHEMMSLPNTAGELNLSPPKKREKLFEAMLAQLAALTRDRVVLAAFEDAHWIDPTSRELLDLMVERVRRLPVLLIITFRPEFQAAWAGQPHVAMLALNRLGERHVLALVQSLAGNSPLGPEVVGEIVERTDGVPLFIEELTKAVLERSSQDNRVAAVLSASPLPTLLVPSTLHASLIARLDRIGAAAKEVAQIGAVLGREFSYELIQPMAERGEGALQDALARLTDAGLLFCRGAPPHSAYLFKHALVQDAAYGTLLRARRQELHARAAAALEEHFVDLVERQPELLAYHLTGAAETEHAVAQWLKAGRYAAERSAHVEAIGHFDRGLALLASIPETPERDRQEIDFLLAKGPSMLTARGVNSPEAAALYQRAHALCEKYAGKDQLFIALWNLWLTTAVRDVNAARPLSVRLLRLTERLDDDTLRLEAHHSAWYTCFAAGDPGAARDHCNEGRRLYDFDRHHALAASYGGHDPGVCARQWGALIEWLLGFPDTAVFSADDGLQLAGRLGHPLSLEHALFNKAILHLLRHEPEQALRRADDGAAWAADQRLALLWDPDIVRAGALLVQDAIEPAVASLRAGLARSGVGGWSLGRQFMMTLASEVLERAGDQEGALAALADAEETARTAGERWWEAEIQRRKGLLCLTRNEVTESQTCFRQALNIARGQGAKSLELRAATSLARLWGEQGDRREAHALLLPVYSSFTEGFDTADLKEAKALLDALG